MPLGGQLRPGRVMHLFTLLRLLVVLVLLLVTSVDAGKKKTNVWRKRNAKGKGEATGKAKVLRRTDRVRPPCFAHMTTPIPIRHQH